MYAGTFSLDGVKGETLNDDDFTPEPGEYVYSAVSRQINGKKVTVGFADNSEALAELTTELFGEETPAPESSKPTVGAVTPTTDGANIE